MHTTFSYSELGFKTIEECNSVIKERLLQLDVKPVQCDYDSYMFTVNDHLAMNGLIEEFGQKAVYDMIKELNLLNTEIETDVKDNASTLEGTGVGFSRGAVQFIGKQTYQEFTRETGNIKNHGIHHFTAQEIADQTVSRNAGRNRVVDIDVCSAYLTDIRLCNIPKLQKGTHNPKYPITSNGGRREVVMGKAGNHYPIPKKRW